MSWGAGSGGCTGRCRRATSGRPVGTGQGRASAPTGARSSAPSRSRSRSWASRRSRCSWCSTVSSSTTTATTPAPTSGPGSGARADLARDAAAASRGAAGHLAGAVLRPGVRVHPDPAHRAAGRRPVGGERATGGADLRGAVLDVRRLRLADQPGAAGATSPQVAADPRMAAFLVCALAIPRAFDGGGLAFGLGYLLVVLLHGPATYALWGVAILIQLVMPYANRSPARPNIRPAHFVERHGLLLIVALGESVVAIGISVGREALTVRLFGTVLLGLALAAALWWTYFAGEEERAEQALESVPDLNRRLLLAVRAYFFAYVPMLLGIISLAAGVKLSLGQATHRLDPGPALTLAAGVALYLAGDVAFRRALRIRPLAYRAAAAPLALATAVLGIYVAGAVQLVALIAVLLGMLVPEARWRRAVGA